MSIDWEVVKTNLYDWAIENGTENMPVIFLNENAPRPTTDYLTLNISSLVQIGEDYTTQPDNDNGIIEMVGNREFTLQIQSYGGFPLDYLEKLRFSLQKQTVLDSLRSNGLIFVNHFQITDITQIIDTGFEQRGSMDVLFRIAQTYEDELGSIHTVNIEEELSDDDSIVFDGSFTVTTQ